MDGRVVPADDEGITAMRQSTGPARAFSAPRLVLASHNPGKLAELEGLLAPHGVAVVSSRELGLPEPEETGATFAANARLKAHAAVEASGLPALADDSGLEAHGLGGAPGVHSARWAGPERDFAKAMARVRDALALRFGDFARADRRAAFVAVLCLAWPDGHEELAEGRVEGELVDPPRGGGGFGYDPMFAPEGLGRTFGEMAPADKQARSHRARAFRRLLAMCFERR
jgi:XTP/dITP diphosphohydrolase